MEGGRATGPPTFMPKKKTTKKAVKADTVRRSAVESRRKEALESSTLKDAVAALIKRIDDIGIANQIGSEWVDKVRQLSE